LQQCPVCADLYQGIREAARAELEAAAAALVPAPRVERTQAGNQGYGAPTRRQDPQS
jgi:hypothetical protein